MIRNLGRGRRLGLQNHEPSVTQSLLPQVAFSPFLRNIYFRTIGFLHVGTVTSLSFRTSLPASGCGLASPFLFRLDAVVMVPRWCLVYEKVDAMWPRMEELLTKYNDLEKQLSDPDIAADGVKFGKIAKEHASLAKQAKPYLEMKNLAAEVDALTADATKEADAEMKAMLEEEIALKSKQRAELQSKLEDMLLIDPSEDVDSVIMEIRAGVGGEEAALFAGNLFEMYQRYADVRGWKVETLDFSNTDMGGFKEVSFNVKGDGVFRYFRYESGGHRVQRVPKTETQGRIHTSAATVAVLPEATEVQIDVRPDDVEKQTFSCGGPGGQHVNKTQSGVRLIHHPTGVVAESRSERSQHKNSDICWRMLRTRIYEAQMEKVRKERAALRKGLVGSGDRNDRIRTYNFPQNRVTDHRINMTVYNLDKVMLGEMNELIRGVMDYDKQQQLASLTGEKK